jgi:predicted RNase H-like nuclease (RuvC/YqgF family)
MFQDGQVFQYNVYGGIVKFQGRFNILLSSQTCTCSSQLLAAIELFKRGTYNKVILTKIRRKGGEEDMKKGVSVVLSLVLVVLFVAALVGCGQEIKAENEKLKAENASLKSDNDKIKGEVQKLKEEVQKAAEKDATIASLTAEKEALMKQVEDLKAQMAKAKAPAKKKK